MNKHRPVRRSLVRAKSFTVSFAHTIFVFALIALPQASASELRGVVLNGTTGKAVAADEVLLLTPSNAGMEENARTHTDEHGHFSLRLDPAVSAPLIRVIHQGVTYHQIVEDSGFLTVNVFDVVPKLTGINAIMDVIRFEATADRLEVKQLVTVRNSSGPPRTLLSDRVFEVQLPTEAKLQYGLIQVEEGQPLKQSPLAGDQPGQYYFRFPLRPGDTRFAVVYDLPYSGRAAITPLIRNPYERFVVMLPKSMNFEPRDQATFEAMSSSTGDNVQGTGPVLPGQTLAFEISGTGTLAELEGRRRQAKQSGAPAKPRPGGGLGGPIGSPDPLATYRWHILGAFAAILVSGALFVVRKGRVHTNALPPLTRDRPAKSSPVHSRPKTKRRQVHNARAPQQAVRS